MKYIIQICSNVIADIDACRLEQILEAKSDKKKKQKKHRAPSQLSQKTNQIIRTKHAGRCWRRKANV